MVRTLLDLGQVELLIRAARERGDWNCAEAAARDLCAAGEFDRALALVDPFTDIGWRAAEWVTAEIMILRGEGDEALAMVRPDPAELGDGHVCARYAELRTRHRTETPQVSGLRCLPDVCGEYGSPEGSP
ncbi:hypothetical protein ACFZBU_43530 [Embleya sp. NPDC008237]|uniref:hypothetical protein n=1 Tax=Embleya sp. NPDC008237 TaxID=3363978 RepID=UPI0036EAEF29